MSSPCGTDCRCYRAGVADTREVFKNALRSHQFVGRLDRGCQVEGCGLPDRHPIHIWRQTAATLDPENLAGSMTWHYNRGHGGSWRSCPHETCRTFTRETDRVRMTYD